MDAQSRRRPWLQRNRGPQDAKWTDDIFDHRRYSVHILDAPAEEYCEWQSRIHSRLVSDDDIE